MPILIIDVAVDTISTSIPVPEKKCWGYVREFEGGGERGGERRGGVGGRGART